MGRLNDTIRRRLFRARVRNRDFTIVTNNCWGAHIYQGLGEPFRTPFIGLFLAPECYLRLLERLRWYLEQPLEFVGASRHEYVNRFRREKGTSYPIGVLGGDVELQFLHYASEDEARDKWSRRVARVPPDDDRIFVKFCDRDGCTPEQIAAFDRLPWRHKVCFVSRPMPELESTVWIPESDGPTVPDGLQLSRISPRYFDAAGWINGQGGRSRWRTMLHSRLNRRPGRPTPAIPP